METSRFHNLHIPTFVYENTVRYSEKVIWIRYYLQCIVWFENTRVVLVLKLAF